jgi:hypothetical protein
MSHLVLLGDSIFDNAAYVPGEPAVIDQVRSALPADWSATLLAVDGAMVAGVPGQLRRLPPDATHLALSVGGNDALHDSWVLGERVSTVAAAMSRLAAVRDDFARSYRALLDQIRATRLPLVACTVYDAIPGFDPAAHAALAFFNEAITREVARAGAGLVDLRLTCAAAADYSALSPIEPSAAGGAKIARALAAAVLDSRPPGAAGRIYA